MDKLENTPQKTYPPVDWDRLGAFIDSVSEQIKETGLQMKESAARMEAFHKETERLISQSRKETDRKLANLSEQFFSQTGHIVEGLMEPSAFKLLRKSGFDITQCCRRMEGANPALNLNMEIDLFYMDTVEAIAVEVKTYCTKTKINHFLKQMQNFKKVFPKYADMKIHVAVAAINYTKEALELAKEKGIMVIRAKNDLFSIDPFEKDKLKFF